MHTPPWLLPTPCNHPAWIPVRPAEREEGVQFWRGAPGRCANKVVRTLVSGGFAPGGPQQPRTGGPGRGTQDRPSQREAERAWPLESQESGFKPNTALSLPRLCPRPST